MTSSEEVKRTQNKVLKNFQSLTSGNGLPPDDEPAIPTAPAPDPSDDDTRGFPGVKDAPKGAGGGRYYGVPNAPQ
ncbi:hypothetical protein KSF_112570 [Reticulibacter mediterranei]|uniref:Uncharacterized protein n=1 Tax=Reticulibacter mediterranei TaxID=2778369 RepID=A0A8J3J069_9CHLR|nr:hypothetical protein [Reticulibacter mediterranei]GHP01210.1 hypothetical protein KSF_112570 [Reticulibacter mediterranei]